MEWEKWGKNDPYYGVITNEKFRKYYLSEESKKDFFDSGKRHIRNVIDVSRCFLDQDFSQKKVLDFGCGVGRLLIPFSEIAEHVVGLDVSESMLKEAVNNYIKYSKQNITLIKSDDNLSLLDGYYDLIHSFIVFQHMTVERGIQIFLNLLGHLEDGGICTIQFIYSHAILGKKYHLLSKEQPNFKLFKNVKSRLRILINII